MGRAQTESIGVILLTAVVVITIGVAGGVVLANTGGDDTTRADLSVEVADEGVAVVHDGGQSIALPELRVVVRSGNETWRPTIDDGVIVRGNGDDRFDAGERWTWRNATLDAGTTTTVRVYERASNTMLAEERRYPTGESSLTPTAMPNETPTERATPTETATPTPTETATPTPEPSPEISGVRLSDNSANSNTNYELTYTVDGEVDRVEVFFGTDDSDGTNQTVQASGAATDPRGTVNFEAGGTMGDEFVIEVRAYAPNGSLADTRRLTDVADGNDPGEGDVDDPDDPAFAGTAIHDLSASEDRFRVDYNVTNRSQFQEVRVQFENQDGGSVTTRTSTDPRGSTEFALGSDGNNEYDIALQLVDDSGIVVEEREVTDTADGESPAGNDDLSRPDSPDLTKRAVIDRTDTGQGSVQYDAQYRTANWTAGSQIEVIFENSAQPDASGVNSSTDANGSVSYTQGYGVDDEYTIRYLVYDDDGVLVDSRVVDDTADGENPAGNDDMTGAESPEFAGTAISDLSSSQADYEIFYNVTNRETFDHVQVEIENLDSGEADATYTSTEPRDAITAYRDQDYGGTLGDRYQITLKLVDDNGIVVDEHVVNDTAGLATGNLIANATLPPIGDSPGANITINDLSDGSPEYSVSYEVANESAFSQVEALFVNRDDVYASESQSSTQPTGTFTHDPGWGGSDYVVVVRVFDADGVVVEAWMVEDTADGNDP